MTCNGETSRITRKKGAIELIDSQRAFCKLRIGVGEEEAAARSLAKKWPQKVACRQEFHPLFEGVKQAGCRTPAIR